MALHTISGDFDGFTFGEIKTEVMFNLGQVNNAGVVSYARYPLARVEKAINEAQEEVAIAVPSIHKICIVNTTADQGWYKCPPGMLPGGIERAYWYEDTDTYTELKIWDRARLDDEYDGWRTADSGSPEIIVPGMQMFGNRFTFEVYPALETGGSWTTEPTGVYLGGAPGTTTTSVTGLATGGSTTTLEDTEVDFTTLGLVAGMVVWDVTDNGYGYIESIAANTITLGAAMSNTADFDAGHSYEIITDFTGVISDWDDDDEHYIFSSELGTISDLQPQANNILLEYLSFPLNLSIDVDYPQVQRSLHTAVIEKATAKLARKGHEKTRQMELAALYDAQAAASIAPFVNAQQAQPFRNLQRRIRVKIR